MFKKKVDKDEQLKDGSKEKSNKKEEKKDYSWVSYFATDITNDLSALDSRVRQLELYVEKINERMGL